MAVKPRAKSEGVLVRELPEELLVYDLERDKAHCLNATSAAVWRYCDGQTTPAEIRARVAHDLGPDVDDDVTSLALSQLGERRLLDGPIAITPGVTRRDLVKRGALVAGVVALPAIASLAAPTVAQAGTCFCGAGCTSSQQCCFNCPTCTSNNCV
jgi:coenzyme PQQ synthesis protein D (PqqD)